VVISVILFFAFIASRYQKFKTNEYVIHFRHGKIISKGRGGKVIKLPLTDEIVVIPTTTQKTLLNASEKILSREYQDIKIIAILYWRVNEPQTAFNQVVWDKKSPNYIEKVLSSATEAIIRTTCASLPIDQILRERTQIIKMVSDQLLNLTKDWGIIIESLEIIEARVLDQDLKDNMEAVKKYQEEQQARLADANAREQYQIREIDVARQAEVAKKEQDIDVQRREMERMEIEAEAYRKSTMIRAQTDADAIKMMKMAEAEAEAKAIQTRMEAEAEGFRKQIEAINTAEENFIHLKLIEKMPEIYKHIQPDQMLVMGQGQDGFNNILGSVLPLMQLIPKFQNSMNKSKESKKDFQSEAKLSIEETSQPHLSEKSKEKVVISP
jgi:regulator of protease activity HflC (stomatin/prohibitin superfamily)